MKKIILATISSISLLGFAHAEILDPEEYIIKNGYTSAKPGNNGVMFYSSINPGDSTQVSMLESEIKRLPKQAALYQACEQMRGNVKARIIQEQGISYDVIATDYGYHDQTMACVIKYILGNSIGTQLVFAKKGNGGMYLVFITGDPMPTPTQ